MNWTRWVEFFQGDEGHLSMTRLLCFLSFWPASWVVIESKDEGILGWYLGAYVLSYIGGKASDAYGKPKKPTMITSNAKDINVRTEGGNVNVNQKRRRMASNS